MFGSSQAVFQRCQSPYPSWENTSPAKAFYLRCMDAIWGIQGPRSCLCLEFIYFIVVLLVHFFHSWSTFDKAKIHGFCPQHQPSRQFLSCGFLFANVLGWQWNQVGPFSACQMMPKHSTKSCKCSFLVCSQDFTFTSQHGPVFKESHSLSKVPMLSEFKVPLKLWRLGAGEMA